MEREKVLLSLLSLIIVYYSKKLIFLKALEAAVKKRRRLLDEIDEFERKIDSLQSTLTIGNYEGARTQSQPTKAAEKAHVDPLAAAVAAGASRLKPARPRTLYRPTFEVSFEKKIFFLNLH